MFDPVTLARENIRNLMSYSSARHEFGGSADVFLDANENAFGSPTGVGLNRYPDPLQTRLKEELSQMNGIRPEQIFVGNGSDEAIDLLLRIFCEPLQDRAMIFPPTYGMYKVCADINGVEVDEVELTNDFQLDLAGIDAQYSAATKVIFICSPNNPTGNSIRISDVLGIAARLNSIVVVDEAYIHFSDDDSLVREIDRYPNLVILQTFSKAWGLAGARVGLAFANSRIIGLLNRVKPPYNVNEISQRLIVEALTKRELVETWVDRIKTQRAELVQILSTFNFVRTVFPSDANFLLVQVDAPDEIYKFLLAQGIVVRNRNTLRRCEGCLRITIGTPDENKRLVDSLSQFQMKKSARRSAKQNI